MCCDKGKVLFRVFSEMVRFLVFGKKRQSVCHFDAESTLIKVAQKTKNQKQKRFRKHPNDCGGKAVDFLVTVL